MIQNNIVTLVTFWLAFHEVLEGKLSFLGQKESIILSWTILSIIAALFSVIVDKKANGVGVLTLLDKQFTQSSKGKKLSILVMVLLYFFTFTLWLPLYLR